MFGRNLAGWDRALRLIVGAVLLSLVFWGPQTAWGWLGLVLMGTALIGHCPLYVLFGFRTCHTCSPSRKA